jgi:hypothetical protein
LVADPAPAQDQLEHHLFGRTVLCGHLGLNLVANSSIGRFKAGKFKLGSTPTAMAVGLLSGYLGGVP